MSRARILARSLVLFFAAACGGSDKTTDAPDGSAAEASVGDLDASSGSPDADARAFDAGQRDAQAWIDGAVEPWPPEALLAQPDPQPQGVGWRSAQWNVCTTSLDGPRVECRARLSPEDSSRTAVELERAAIAKYFAEDSNLYSFTLQEVCEQDARWVAAFVANGGPPLAGWRGDFSAAENLRMIEQAPYAFLPYFTRELLNDRDLGCGAGVSTGVAVIAKRIAGSSGLKVRGLQHDTFEERRDNGFTQAHLQRPEVCALYFDAQTSYGPLDESTGQDAASFNFRSAGCKSDLPDTYRGLACVRTRWRGPGDATSYRVSTCATHAVHRGATTWSVRNQHIDEAGRETFAFAGGTNQRVLLSGDFNVVARRGEGSSLEAAEQGHHTILTAPRYGLSKVTVGDHVGTSRTGTLRVGSSPCGREIDAIYAKNAWWTHGGTPHPSLCRDYPESEPPLTLPDINPWEWSDHEMMVTPLMSPHGAGTADF